MRLAVLLVVACSGSSPPPLDMVWTRTIPEVGALAFDPSGALYATDGHGVVRYAPDGTEAWRVPLGDRVGSPRLLASGDGVVVAACVTPREGRVIAVSAQGVERWRYPIECDLAGGSLALARTPSGEVRLVVARPSTKLFAIGFDVHGRSRWVTEVTDEAPTSWTDLAITCDGEDILVTATGSTYAGKDMPAPAPVTVAIALAPDGGVANRWTPALARPMFAINTPIGWQLERVTARGIATQVLPWGSVAWPPADAKFPPTQLDVAAYAARDGDRIVALTFGGRLAFADHAEVASVDIDAAHEVTIMDAPGQWSIGTDVAIARLTPAGSARWLEHIGGPGNDTLRAAAFGGDRIALAIAAAHGFSLAGRDFAPEPLQLVVLRER